MTTFFSRFPDAPAPETTFFSRFPDALTPETKPLPMPEIYSIHLTDTELAMTIRWTMGPIGWVQHAPLFAEEVGLALEMVPPGALPIPSCPLSFALAAYEVRP